MKNFFGEFKKFILRGNVIDMAVGVIIGGAFTAIVTALTNNILQPLINWILFLICGSKGIEDMYTVLVRVTTLDADGLEVLDTANSIYIDWGAFISAIINFLLIAIVLFCIIKTINSFAEAGKKAKADIQKKKEAVEKYKSEGLTAEEALAKFEAEEAAAAEAAAADAKAAEEAAAAEAQAKEEAPVKLLEEIRDLLKSK